MIRPLKSVAPSERLVAARDAMLAALRAYADLTPEELLAVSSQLVGQLVALQDQRRISPAEAIAIVESNMEIGNAMAIERLATEVAGRA